MSTQSEHLVPLGVADRNRLRTGYERVLAHRVGRQFAAIPEKDGVVSNINQKTKMIEVKYSDGTKDVFQYGSIYTPFQGFYADNNLECICKVGQKFKQGDILAYNKGFFTYDKYSKQIDFSVGNLYTVAVMEMDTALEDATLISKRMGEGMRMYPVNVRVVTLDRKSKIHYCAKVGDHVINTDDIMIFEEQDVEKGGITSDDEALALLSDLNRSTPSAKFNGQIVEIRALSGCQISEMSPSLGSVVKQAIDLQNSRSKLASGTPSEDDYPASGIQPRGTKFKGVTFDADTVCLLFFIQEGISAGTGDKVVFCNQVKSTIAGVMPMPYFAAETGREIDALFSASGIGRRLVLSPVLSGIMNVILEKLEDNIVDMYFK